MDVITWLRTLRGADEVVLAKLRAERDEALFEKQETLKVLGRARQERAELEERSRILTDQLIAAHEVSAALEETASKEEEAKILACAQVETLKEEISYFKEQVKIYQVRLGLLPQERQGQIEATEHKPLRSARMPFAQASAKIQAQRTEEYWREKAAAVKVNDDGVTGTTTQTVSDKES